jgi:hypothetical protein
MTKSINLNSLLPDIKNYLADTDPEKFIQPDGLEDLIFKISAKTGLDKKNSEFLLVLFFQELRSSLLEGNKVGFPSLGYFFILKKSSYLKFSLAPSLKKEINGK